MRGQKPVAVAAAGDGWGSASPGSEGAGDSPYPQDGNGYMPGCGAHHFMIAGCGDGFASDSWS